VGAVFIMGSVDDWSVIMNIVLTVLLVISEWLGLSKCDANAISQLMIKGFNNPLCIKGENVDGVKEPVIVRVRP